MSVAIGLAELPGLSTDEAARALERAGPNDLAPPRRGEALRELLGTLFDPMALMLLGTGILYLLLHETRDAIVMFVALIPVLGVDVLLEARSRRALAALANATAARAKVRRDGATLEIPARLVVPGDLLLLEAGDVIAADARVIDAANFAVDEALLTGEAEPVAKRAAGNDDETSVFAGASVLTGQAMATVLTTGVSTRFGAIARMVATDSPRTPLQQRVFRAVRGLALVAAVAAALLFLLVLRQGAPPAQAFLTGLSFAIAAIPEEFPLVFAIFLSVGAWRLGQRGVLVRHIAAVETLGSTTVLCVDKTGTLTAGHFSLEDHHALSGSDNALLTAAVLACESAPTDPLEAAIDAHAAEHGIDPNALRRAWSMLWDYDFDPVGKHMSHVRRGSDGEARVDAKGSLEGILEHCALAPGEREAALALEADLARRGIRVLAVATRSGTFSGDRDGDERALKLLGLLGFRDPLRPEVPAAIAAARSAGIRVKILTGDHVLTASAIASAAGIGDGTAMVLTGAEIDSLPPDELAARVKHAAVLARLRPEQKHAIVTALQRSGEVVAMTGDGVNDAPALVRADIGISMGKRASEVARRSADLILLDDRFEALVDTVRAGRAIFGNLQRSFLYLIAFHIPIVVLAIAAPLLGMPLLLLPIHLVWLELVVHPVSTLVFEAEPPRADVMELPPRAPSASLVERGPVLRSTVAGTALAATVLAEWAWLHSSGAAAARSVSLATLILGSLLLVTLERLRDTGAAHPGFLPPSARARLVLLGVAASVPVAIEIPFFADVLSLAPLDLQGWSIALGAAFLATGWGLFVGTRRRGSGRSAPGA